LYVKLKKIRSEQIRPSIWFCPWTCKEH